MPLLGIPSVPFSLETLAIIAPYALTLAAGGLLESLLTAKLVDDITETGSDKDREARGQGIANVITGFFGGMAGCAMIGQTMINVRTSGARTRLSTLSAGVFLLVLVVGLGDLVAVIPIAALVAVMVLVAVSTFDWHSIAPATLRRMPAGETLIMVVTVVGTVSTHNLALGVGAGVLMAMALFARRVAHVVDVERVLDPDGTSCIYSVTGELFFASEGDFIEAFEYAADPPCSSDAGVHAKAQAAVGPAAVSSSPSPTRVSRRPRPSRAVCQQRCPALDPLPEGLRQDGGSRFARRARQRGAWRSVRSTRAY